MREHYIWTLPRVKVALGERTAVMGILNVTPDSFSDGGEYFDLQKAVARGREIEQQGADILDIGGESTRPGSEPVSEDEESRRVISVVEALAPVLRIPISVDTYRAAVAKRAIEAGAQIVNDISGFRFDREMPRVVEDSGAGVVLMHSRGNRQDLHKQPKMHDVINEVRDSLSQSVGIARAAGIPDRAIIVDPGIGFGKDASENLKILKRLTEFSTLGYPLLIGTSRKSVIRSIVQDLVEIRVWGTAATVAAAILNGSHIVRVHDVRGARVLADVTDGILQA